MPAENGLEITREDHAAFVQDEAPKGLYRKLIALMAAVSSIEKRGEMLKDQKVQYTYIKASDMFAAIHPEMVRLGLLCFPRIKEQQQWERRTEKQGYTSVLNFVQVVMEFRWVDADNPAQSVTFDGIGQGMDSGDKAAQKATLVAFKYALRNHLMIADDSDDGDQSPSEPEQTKRKPRSEKERYESFYGTVTRCEVMSEKTVWLELNSNGIRLRSVTADISRQLRNSLGCKIKGGGVWQKMKMKSNEGDKGPEVEVLTVTRLFEVMQAVPVTQYAHADEYSQEDHHVSPDMEPDVQQRRGRR